MSSHLSPMWAQARKAAEMLKGRYTIRVLDSQTTSYGLGLLVQMAAQAADAGANVNDIARIVNGAVPHLYCHFLHRESGLLAAQRQPQRLTKLAWDDARHQGHADDRGWPPGHARKSADPRRSD